MAISYQPASWGGPNTSKDYEFLMQGTTPVSTPVSLAGEHSIDTPSDNLTDPVVKRYVKKVKGRLVDREQVTRTEDRLSLTFRVAYGDGLETPLLQRARNKVNTTIAALRLCPVPGAGHAYIWESATPKPPSRANAVISIEDTVPATWQNEWRADDEIVIKELGNFGAVTSAGVAYYAVAFLSDDCVSANGNQFADLIAVGGAGGVSDAIRITLTNDRFATSTAITGTGAPLGSIGNSIYTNGDNVLIGFADKAPTASGTATAGGTLMSVDGGSTYAIDTNISAGIYAVGRFGNVYLAAGGTASGAPYLGTSTDGTTWTAVTSAVFPATGVFTGLSVDELTGRIYLVTAGGKAFAGLYNGGSLNFSELTLTGSPSALYAVRVLGKDFVAISGASGYYAESQNAGVSWTRPVVPTSSAIYTISGKTYRTIMAGGTKVGERSILNLNDFAVVPNQNGLVLAGNITSIASTSEGDYNFFAGVTASGEVFFTRDFSPYS